MATSNFISVCHLPHTTITTTSIPSLSYHPAPPTSFSHHQRHYHYSQSACPSLHTTTYTTTTTSLSYNPVLPHIVAPSPMTPATKPKRPTTISLKRNIRLSPTPPTSLLHDHHLFPSHSITSPSIILPLHLLP